MRVIISRDIQVRYPDLRIGIVTGLGVSNVCVNYNKLQDFLREVIGEAGRRGYTPETLSTHPYMACWRSTYSSFGAKPKKHRPTAEAVVRRVLQGGELPSINPIVDVYLGIELRWWLPIGGYDLDAVQGDIMLRLSSGGEQFNGIGESDPEITDPGEVVYADDCRVLTRRWNYRDADATKITTETHDIALFVEAPGKDIPSDALEECAKDLAINLGDICGGSWRTAILDVSQSPVCELLSFPSQWKGNEAL